MQHHTGLRQREGQKGADGEERDQMVGDAVKHHQQQPRGKTEVEYADRENQPATNHREWLGKIPVFSHHAAKAGKIDEAGVGRKREHAEQAADGNVIENTVADHGMRKLRKNALIAVLLLVHRADAIACRQEGDAAEQKPQD